MNKKAESFVHCCCKQYYIVVLHESSSPWNEVGTRKEQFGLV